MDRATAKTSRPPHLANSIAFRALLIFLVVLLAVPFSLVWRYESESTLLEPHLSLSVGKGSIRQFGLPLAGAVRGGSGGGGSSRNVATYYESGGAGLSALATVRGKGVNVRSVLEGAGISVDESMGLPSDEEIGSMYGSEAVVVGLESCKAFRSAVRPADRYIAPAGTMNTGTNIMATLLRRNCYIPEREGAFEDRWKSGVLFQVPWGKHNPVSWRLHNVAQQGGQDVIQTDVLPAVVIRDPLTWMTSMCRHPYSVRLGKNCKDTEFSRSNLPVATNYKNKDTTTNYDSFVGMWHTWYSEWMNVSFPRVFVRFEDLLFHPEEVVKKVCDCAGGSMRDTFYHKEESAKGEIGPHAGGSGLLKSIVQYGNSTARNGILKTASDKSHIRDRRFADLLGMFHYSTENI